MKTIDLAVDCRGILWDAVTQREVTYKEVFNIIQLHNFMGFEEDLQRNTKIDK